MDRNKWQQITNKLKYILNEMAFNRNKAIGEITNLCIPYTEHILKLSVFGHDEKHVYDIPKWKDEIYNFLKQASLYYELKGNKHLKPKDYTDNFFFGLMEYPKELQNNFEKILKDFPRKGYIVPNNINYKNIYNNHKLFVNNILKVFPDISYEQIQILLDTYIVGSGVK